MPRFLSLLLLLTLAPASLSAPLDELLPLVPDDAGVCLIAVNLRQNHERLTASPWLKKLRESDFGQKMLRSPEAGKLLQVEQELKKHLNLTWEQLRDDILGDAIVLAYRQGPPGQPEQERGLLLLWARKPDLLQRVLDAANREQLRTGELKALEPREHRGVRYWLRKEDKQDRYYVRQDNLLAFGSTEEMIKTVITRHQLAPEKRTLGPVARSLQKLDCTETLLTVWLNPRAFDAELKEAVNKAQGAAVEVLATFGKCWQALDGLSLGLVAGPDVELRLTLQGRSDDLPSGIRTFAQASGGTSELWQRFPPETLLICAGRLPPGPLFQALGDLQSEASAKKMREALQRNLGAVLGLEFFEEVLPHVGPDWGLCLMRAADSKHAPHLLFAVKVAPGPRPGTPVDRGLSGTLRFFAGLAVFDHNKHHKHLLRLKSAIEEKTEIHYLDGPGVFPAGVQPAWALKDGYLVLASSPAALKRFALHGTKLPEGTLLRLSFRELALLAKEQRAWLTDVLTKQNQLPEKAVNNWIDGLLWGLGVFERLEVQQRRTPGQIAWTLRLSAARQ